LRSTEQIICSSSSLGFASTRRANIRRAALGRLALLTCPGRLVRHLADVRLPARHVGSPGEPFRGCLRCRARPPAPGSASPCSDRRARRPRAVVAAGLQPGAGDSPRGAPARTHAAVGVVAPSPARQAATPSGTETRTHCASPRGSHLTSSCPAVTRAVAPPSQDEAWRPDASAKCNVATLQ
jgi:hypothetical protein